MARFFPDSGALFQHVPRTGGTFVYEAITTLAIPATYWSKQRDGVAKKHALLSHYHREYKPQVKFVFAFVRHPVAYYLSVWRYLREARLSSRRRLNLLITKYRWHPFRQAALLYKPDFEQWAELMFREEPAWATRLMGWYVGPEHGEFCEFIGRTETLRSDLTHVLIHLGHDVHPATMCRIPFANSSYSPAPDVSDELREAICREERVLIRRFYSPSTLAKRWYGTGSA